MPPLRTPDECREKVNEIIGEAVVEDDDARREGLLKMADEWIEVARRRQTLVLAPRTGRCD